MGDGIHALHLYHMLSGGGREGQRRKGGAERIDVWETSLSKAVKIDSEFNTIKLDRDVPTQRPGGYSSLLVLQPFQLPHAFFSSS